MFYALQKGLLNLKLRSVYSVVESEYSVFAMMHVLLSVY